MPNKVAVQPPIWGGGGIFCTVCTVSCFCRRALHTQCCGLFVWFVWFFQPVYRRSRAKLYGRDGLDNSERRCWFCYAASPSPRKEHEPQRNIPYLSGVIGRDALPLSRLSEVCLKKWENSHAAGRSGNDCTSQCGLLY